MSMPLQAGAVAVTNGNPGTNSQIYIAAEAIWGIKSAKLPQAKFDELKAVLAGNLTREYGPYSVEGIGNAFVISADPEVLEASYQKRPCSVDTCMVTNAAFKCAKCREAMYCSREHQVLDRPRHKVECISHK